MFTHEELEKAGGRFHRYLDVDGDGIAARTLPGTHPRGAYFTRGSGHNKLGGYTEDGREYQEVIDRIDRKILAAGNAVPAPFVRATPGATLGIISIGGCHAAVMEAVDRLAQQGIAIDYLRVRGFPFGDAVRAFLDAHDHLFIVEQNRDAQLRSLLMIETGVPVATLTSVRDYSGMPLSAHVVVDGVMAHVETIA